jgi:hypothetical protein
MCWTAGIVSAEKIFDIVPAAQIVHDMAHDARASLEDCRGDD